MSDAHSTTKTCTKCGAEYPATTEYFHKSRGGLRSVCKACRRAYRIEHREEHRARDARWYAKHREEKLQRSARYRAEHQEEQRVYNARYYVENKESISTQQARYTAEHQEELRVYYARWRTENPEVGKAAIHRYRARKRRLPNDFTAADWRYALDYFHGCCAVCGRQLIDLFDERTAAGDHWIALTDPRPDNPGTVPSNILPLCHGVDGCNNSKRNRDPIEWLIERFGNRRAKVISERIAAFFGSVRKNVV